MSKEQREIEFLEELRKTPSGVKIKLKDQSSCGCKFCTKWAGQIVTFKRATPLRKFDFYERKEGEVFLRTTDIEYILPNIPEHLFEI